MSNPKTQQVMAVVQLNLELDITMSEEDIGVFLRNHLYGSLKNCLNPNDPDRVDILQIREEAEIYGNVEANDLTVVYIGGGLVQGIESTVPTLDIVVVDRDEPEEDVQEALKTAKAKKGNRTLTAVY